MASEAEILEALNLGTARAVLDNKGASPLSRLLQESVTEVVELFKQALKNRDINTSSARLSQSMAVTQIQFEGNTLLVGASAEFYWKYVNYGVNGTEFNRGAPNWGPAPQADVSFFEAIRDWIPERGIQLPPQFDDFTDFTYAIMNKIRRYGKEARPFFEDVVNDALIASLREPIEALLGRAIQITIVAPWQ